MSEREEPCAACGGQRTISVDMFTPSRGHFTIELDCDMCTGDEYADLEPEDLGPLERSVHLLDRDQRAKPR